MKNKVIKRFFILVALLAMLGISAGSAFAVTNTTSVVAPYWQTDSDSYTFVAVSHTSLSGMSSEIGVVLTVMTDDASTTFATSAFTVSQNDTRRVFIVATNHGTINSTNITGTDAVFITGTTNSSQGSLVFVPRSSAPTLNRQGAGTSVTQVTDITTLSYWGAVVVSSANSGFAMEFIGDTHDSVFNVLTTNSTYQTVVLGLN